jgi:hypothetical protein
MQSTKDHLTGLAFPAGATQKRSVHKVGCLVIQSYDIHSRGIDKLIQFVTVLPLSCSAAKSSEQFAQNYRIYSDIFNLLE